MRVAALVWLVDVRRVLYRFSVQVMFSVLIQMEARPGHTCMCRRSIQSTVLYIKPGVYFSQRQ